MDPFKLIPLLQKGTSLPAKLTWAVNYFALQKNIKELGETLQQSNLLLTSFWKYEFSSQKETFYLI